MRIRVQKVYLSVVEYLCEMVIKTMLKDYFVMNAGVLFITARRNASAVLWPCVRLCLSQVGVLLKRLNGLS